MKRRWQSDDRCVKRGSGKDMGRVRATAWKPRFSQPDLYKPRVALMDEATVDFDPTSRQLLDTARDLCQNRGMSVL